MAKAKTNVQLSATWQYSLEVLCQALYLSPLSAPTRIVQGGALGAVARWENTDGQGNRAALHGAPREHAIDDPGPGGEAPGVDRWQGVYWPFTLSVEVSGMPPDTDSKLYLVYVGDNPHKDFVGVRSLGSATIRIHTGSFKDDADAADHDGDYHINEISELPSLIIQLSSGR